MLSCVYFWGIVKNKLMHEATLLLLTFLKNYKRSNKYPNFHHSLYKRYVATVATFIYIYKYIYKKGEPELTDPFNLLM